MTSSRDDVGRLIVAEAQARRYIRGDCLAVMSALDQESGWDETIWDPTHTTYGVAQQDGSYPNRFDGAAAQIKGSSTSSTRGAPNRAPVRTSG